MTVRPRRLVSVGHSYVVALNRRLPHEIARVSGGQWEVTAVAPRFVRAELRNIALEPGQDEACRLEAVDMRLSKHLHIAFFDSRLRDILRGGNWDMVHLFQDAYILPAFQPAYWTPPNVPLVFFANQNLVKNYVPPFSWMERYCVDRCAGWIGCGETVLEALKQKGYGRKPHRRIGYGVDTEAFHPDKDMRERTRRHLGWDDSVPVVAFLGRLTPEKGIDLLTSVLGKLRVPWRALFIGNGPMRERLEQWSKNFADQVRIVSVRHDEVPAYLNAADILCAPSQTAPNWREQFGRMIIEAFATGAAVVGSNSGEIPYVIGDAGFIVQENDEAAWVETLERLLTDDALRSEFGQRGRTRALEHFAWPVIARAHIDFFEELLAGAGDLAKQLAVRG